MIKQNIEKFAPYGGLVAVCFEWLALFAYFIEYPQYFGNRYPISYYATLPGTKWVFSICYLIAAISSWTFIQHHLSKYLKVPVKTFTLSMVCFAVTALIPYHPSIPLSNIVHILFSGLTFWTFIIGIFLVSRLEQKLHQKISAWAAALSGVLLAILIFSPKGSNFTFALEAGSWFICQLWLIWISLRLLRE